jgi:hypothetical protein
MSHAEIAADLQKRSISKKILAAGVGDVPKYADGGKVRVAHSHCAG